jgi:hypothetical protein
MLTGHAPNGIQGESILYKTQDEWQLLLEAGLKRRLAQKKCLLCGCRCCSDWKHCQYLLRKVHFLESDELGLLEYHHVIRFLERQ